MFYPDVKEYMSPSAFQSWMRSRSSFVKSYFEGERTPETAAMKGGTMIHRLIEAGLLEAKLRYKHNEMELRHPADTFDTMGKPDSFEKKGKTAYFVDYKSGKANGWEAELPKDLKMLFTAWLVWNACGKPEKVEGAIEFFQTTWNPETKEVEPLEKESETIHITYHAEQLKAFTDVIIREMNAVNAFYIKWTDKDTSFIDESDCKQLAKLTAEIDQRAEQVTKLKERILTQMEFGGVTNHNIEGLGTFYLTTKKTYQYPPALKVNYLDYGLTLEDAEEVAKCVSAAKKNFELVNKPVTESTSMGYRKPTKKK